MSLPQRPNRAAPHLFGEVRLPESYVPPLRQIAIRAAAALGLLALVVLVVYVDRDGYRDTAGGSLSVLDALYYATVSLTTTGYGDITPITSQARLTNVLLVTPLRIAFLIVLVGTTLEVLATRSREQWRISRWRTRLRDHTVVVGYGTKGRSAIDTLVNGGIPADRIVVVDASAGAVAEANAAGLSGVVGDATRADVLRRAEVSVASRVIVTAHRDDTAVLVTLTARQLNPSATVVVSVREAENIRLLRQSGADVTVTSSDAVGRIMGLSTVSPALGTVLEDLLSYGEGMEVAERPVLPREEGRSPRNLDDVAVAVVRGGEVYRYFDPTVSQLLRGDRVIVVRPAEELPWAPRPGGEHEAHDESGDAEEVGPIRPAGSDVPGGPNGPGGSGARGSAARGGKDSDGQAG
ncbi:voltage-gated potassium channel [Actinopolymorpha cephalotaxi]|uniref:Voltage-gated potassium channel n=1 Tax=Actinopolymorpha cephalotaxi TaxID=504797 RepID=A0A1I2UQ64_9ACTN|nr:potassium channel family protein [Actinopolymorpha cephalotaxi]NYH86689.1 voltage-gated potassium channel [Actinopolymorpha cephalotaxi]SFG79253.1 voltage-gated potassium channel [Actinopolymorpha cephalotaxi]